MYANYYISVCTFLLIIVSPKLNKSKSNTESNVTTNCQRFVAVTQIFQSSTNLNPRTSKFWFFYKNEFKYLLKRDYAFSFTHSTVLKNCAAHGILWRLIMCKEKCYTRQKSVPFMRLFHNFHYLPQSVQEHVWDNFIFYTMRVKNQNWQNNFLTSHFKEKDSVEFIAAYGAEKLSNESTSNFNRHWTNYIQCYK